MSFTSTRDTARSAGHLRDRSLSLVSGLLDLIADEIRVRRALRELSALGDEGLHDIGLTRSDLEDVVRYGRPPSAKRHAGPARYPASTRSLERADLTGWR